MCVYVNGSSRIGTYCHLQGHVQCVSACMPCEHLAHNIKAQPHVYCFQWYAHSSNTMHMHLYTPCSAHPYIPVATRTHQCTPIHTCVHPHTPVYTHTYQCTSIHTTMHTYTHQCTPIHTRAYPYTTVHTIYTCVHP